MPEYRVTYSVDVEAESHQEAAMQLQGEMVPYYATVTVQETEDGIPVGAEHEIE
jgi:hypothetical protein